MNTHPPHTPDPAGRGHGWIAVFGAGLTLVLCSAACVTASRSQAQARPAEECSALIRGAPQYAPRLANYLLEVQARSPERTVARRGEASGWEFFPDGTFRWTFLSDYRVTHTGSWALAADSDSSGVVVTAWYGEPPARSLKRDVLSLRVKEDATYVGEQPLHHAPGPKGGPPPAVPAALRDAVRCPVLTASLPLWSAMTEGRWEREAGGSSPNRLWFHPDGTFEAAFRATECSYSGTWSLRGINDSGATLLMSVPSHECDPRGPRTAFLREVPIQLRDEQLVLNRDTYSRTPDKQGRR